MPRLTQRRAAAFVLLLLLSSAAGAQGPNDLGRPDASWGRIVARILDGATGQPVANIRSVLQCNSLDGRWGRLVAMTDANGQFTLDTPPGQCTAAFNVPMGLAFQGPGLRLFEIAPGETVEVVHRIRRYPAAQTIEGRLLDDAGAPVSGARVVSRSNIVLAGTRQLTVENWRPAAVTDAAGTFRFPNTRPGTYEIVAPALGLSRLVNVTGSTDTPAPPVTIVIRGARLPVHRVTGRVETPPGRASTFVVYLDRADSSPDNPLTIAFTSTDATGNFSFDGVPAGSYRARLDTSPTTSPGPGKGPTEIFWAVTPVVVAGDVSGVVLNAQPGPELTAEVRLDDQPGGRMPGQRILLSINAASGRLVANPLITQDGMLFTRGLLPERYRIRATGIPTGYRVKSVTTAGRDVTVEGFDLRNGPIGDLVITLTKQVSELKGVVRNAQDRPDGEAAVLAFPTDRRLWTETGHAPTYIDNVHVSQKGNYSLKGLPAGEYFVVATTSDPFLTTDAETLAKLAPFAERIRLKDAETLTVNLRTQN